MEIFYDNYNYNYNSHYNYNYKRNFIICVCCVWIVCVWVACVCVGVGCVRCEVRVWVGGLCVWVVECVCGWSVEIFNDKKYIYNYNYNYDEN